MCYKDICGKDLNALNDLCIKLEQDENAKGSFRGFNNKGYVEYIKEQTNR